MRKLNFQQTESCLINQRALSFTFHNYRKGGLNSFYHQYSFHSCTCGNCGTGLLQNAKECCCCLEIENCLQFIEVYCKDGKGALKCITDHPGFPAVCLNEWSLEIAADNYKTRDGRRYRQTGSKEK